MDIESPVVASVQLLAHPPSMPARSSTVTRSPLPSKSMAQVSPASPPPIMTTSVFIIESGQKVFLEGMVVVQFEK